MIKIKAQNDEDLKIIASLLQDSIIPIGDFAYFKSDEKVMFATNRYCWENEKNKQRINSVLTILNVKDVKIRNIDITDRSQTLYTLDISNDDKDIIVSFSENRQMKISVDDLDVSLVDVDEPWEVELTPTH